VRPFLPFSGRWYAWDIMPIFDPLLLALFVLGLAVPWVLRMVSEEVGERGARKVNGAVFCLVTMALLWGIRDVAHRRAVNILDGRLYSDELPQSVGAFPVMVNPFNWVGVVETESAFHVMRVNTLSANPLPEEAETFQKPQSSPALRAALETPAARIFLDFARFPWAQVEEDEDGYEVSVSDLRFFHPGAQVRGFTLEVNLNKALRTQSAKFFFVAPRPK